MTWKNGDTEPDRLPAACLARAPPAEKPRDGALHRWVEVYWAGAVLGAVLAGIMWRSPAAAADEKVKAA